MGVVYRARDERLQRDVALKVLPPETAADEGVRQRARAEAVVLSRLNHPGVATVYDFDTQDGVSFLVLEYLPGESLDAVVSRGALPEPEVVSIGIQVTDALAAAHARGVVHRDLKPANLRRLPDNRIKVLDFGLARLLRSTQTLALTLPAAGRHAAGTVAYMAPEVIAGQQADERSDLYALGVVLFELGIGRTPFAGDSVVALMYAVLNQSPPAPRTLRPELSAGFEAIVLRAMDRDPLRRHATAAELGAELRVLAAGGPAGGTPAPLPVRSLVVLPLENLSGDPSQEFFSDGMTDALISGLAKVAGLRVISRTSAMRYKGARKPLPEIAAELRVDAVIEGSVVRSGERVRINAQLIHAGTDALLWGESYEREIRDVLALQSEVAHAVANEVRAAVSATGAKAAAGGPAQAGSAREAAERNPASGAGSPVGSAGGPASGTGSRASGAASPTTARSARRVEPAAFDAYLRGLQDWHRRTADSLHRAIESFREAIRLDPGWAPAHAGLAESWAVIGFYGYEPPREAFPQARCAAERALQLDDSLGEAYSVLGYVLHYHDWQPREAEQAYRRGVELSPGSAVAHLWFTNLLASAGRFEEGRVHGREALALDPLAPIMHIVPGWVSYFARDFDRALVEMGRARELDPTFWSAQLWFGWAALATGHNADALAAFEEAVRCSERTPEPLGALACAAARVGDERRARALLGDLRQVAARRFVAGFFPALVHAELGEHDAAFECLELAVTQRSHWLMWIRVDPRLDSLRADPRFEQLRRTLGLAG
jgi:TolB-like protein/Tfp pilus assembly protein PilF